MLLICIYLLILYLFIKSELRKEPETSFEKGRYFVLWLLCLWNPVISGSVMYFSWKKRMPSKAKQANRVSFLAIGFWIIGFLLLVLLMQKNIISKDLRFIYAKPPEKTTAVVRSNPDTFVFRDKEFVLSDTSDEANAYTKTFTQKESLDTSVSEGSDKHATFIVIIKVKNKNSYTQDDFAQELKNKYESLGFSTEEEDYVSEKNKDIKVLSSLLLRDDDGSHLSVMKELTIIYLDKNNDLTVLSYYEPKIVDTNEYEKMKKELFSKEVDQYLNDMGSVEYFGI